MQVIKGGKSEGGSRRGSPLTEAPEDARTFVVLAAAGETFAVAVEVVKEIIKVPAITWIPGSRDPVKGVINLRGSVVPVIDLAGVLSLPVRGRGEDARVVVVEHESETVGFLVDRVIEVAAIAAETIEPSMRTLAENEKHMVHSQTTLAGILTGILDMKSVISAAQATQGAA